MINGMYISTMGAMVQASRSNTIANNLANVNTNGYKPDWSRQRALPTESAWLPWRRLNIDEILEKTGGGTWLESTVTDLAPGPMEHTGNPFDLALKDDADNQYRAFFMVRPAGGAEDDVLYTRSGHFIPDSDGVLRTPRGDTLLGADGAPVTLTGAPGTRYEVRPDGVIEGYLDGEVALQGQIGIARTADQFKLVKVGDNLFERADATMEAWQDGVEWGYLEKSAANAIEEMTNMIEAHRAYDLNMRFVSMQDETLGQTVRRITAVS